LSTLGVTPLHQLRLSHRVHFGTQQETPIIAEAIVKIGTAEETEDSTVRLEYR
jgi:hypothetical protein